MKYLRSLCFITTVTAVSWISCSYAEDLDNLRSEINSQICPANPQKYVLSSTSCEVERARLIARGTNPDETYRAFQQCKKAEDEKNLIINEYNAFISRCEAADRQRKFDEKEKQSKAKRDQEEMERNKKESSPNKPISDIDRRLEQARAKSEATGQKSRLEMQNMIKGSIDAEQSRDEQAEQYRRKRDEIANQKPKLICYGENGQSIEVGFIRCKEACAVYYTSTQCKEMCYSAGSSNRDGKSCFYSPGR